MQEVEEREESVRVLREGAPDSDREAVTIEKTKTIRKTIERPKRSSRKGTNVNKIAERLVSQESQGIPSLSQLEDSQSQDMEEEEEEEEEEEAPSREVTKKKAAAPTHISIGSASQDQGTGKGKGKQRAEPQPQDEEEEEDSTMQSMDLMGEGEDGSDETEGEEEEGKAQDEEEEGKAQDEEEEGKAQDEEEEEAEEEEVEEPARKKAKTQSQTQAKTQTQAQSQSQAKSQKAPPSPAKTPARQSTRQQEKQQATKRPAPDTQTPPAGGKRPKTTPQSTPTTRGIPSKKPKAPKKTPAKKHRKRRENVDGLAPFNTYIYRVLKSLHPTLGVSKRGMEVMNSFIYDLYGRLTNESRNLVEHGKRKTLTALDIQSAVRLVLPGDLRAHAIAEGTQALTRLTGKRMSKK